MLLIRTKLALSAIEGFGLFADEFIPKGTVIWAYHEGFDGSFQTEALATLPPLAREQILRYSYRWEPDAWVLCADNARFMNHADDANTTEEDHGTVASRDIVAGEEITCNYFEFDLDAAAKLHRSA